MKTKNKKINFKELDKNFLPTKKWLKDYFKDLINKSNINIKWILFEENKIGFYILEKLKNKYTDKKKILVKDLFIIKKFRRKKSFGSWCQSYEKLWSA